VTEGQMKISQLERLDSVLLSQVSAHEKLLKCLSESQEAIRMADMDAFGIACKQKHEIAVEITELERTRLELIVLLTAAIKPGAESPLKLTELALLIDEPLQGRLQLRADALRKIIHEVRKKSSIVRQAVEVLGRHMTGLVQTVQGAVTGTGVYGKRGRFDDNCQLRFSVDVRS
jgi:hypothetical protein